MVFLQLAFVLEIGFLDVGDEPAAYTKTHRSILTRVI